MPARSLVRLALGDAGIRGPKQQQAIEPLEQLGVELLRGDLNFGLDLNETTDAELVAAGFPARRVNRFRASVTRLQALGKARPSSFDDQEQRYVANGTAFEKLLAHNRLLGFKTRMEAIGVERPTDLTELTDEDLRNLKMKDVPRRRFQRLLRNSLRHYSQAEALRFTSKGTSTKPCPMTHCYDNRQRKHMLERTASFLFDRARLNGPAIIALDHFHGVETLGDLKDVSTNMLLDAGARPLHLRRFQAAEKSIIRGPGSSEPTCVGSLDALLNGSRIGQFTRKLRGRFGVESAKHLLELKREDLVAAAFGTLHRQRFYRLQSRLASDADCKVRDGPSTDNGILQSTAAGREDKRHRAQTRLHSKLTSILSSEMLYRTRNPARWVPPPLTSTSRCFLGAHCQANDSTTVSLTHMRSSFLSHAATNGALSRFLSSVDLSTFLTSSDMRSFLASADMTELLGSGGLSNFLGSGTVSAVVFSTALNGFLNSTAMASFQSSRHMSTFLSSSAVTTLMGSRAVRLLLGESGPPQSFLAKVAASSTTLRKFLSSDQMSKFMQSPALRRFFTSPAVSILLESFAQEGSESLASSGALSNLLTSSALGDVLGSAAMRDFLKSRVVRLILQSSSMSALLSSDAMSTFRTSAAMTDLLNSVVSSSSTVVAHGTSWTPWTPDASPWPTVHPMGLSCNVSQLRLPPKIEQRMCLNPVDHISKKVAETGRWRGCASLVKEWHETDSGSNGIFLELGANIGACTLEMLLLTSARVVAVEPSRVNLFHLTRSLKWAAAERAEMFSRVAVLPVAAGHQAQRSHMRHEKGTSRNTWMADTDGSGLTRREAFEATSETVDVYSLDQLLPKLQRVRVMKLDVQV